MSFPFRLCSILLMAASSILGQGFSFGVKGGVPLMDTLDVLDRSRYLSDKAPYVIGPVVELRLFAGLAGEADLLYRRVEYTSTIQATPQAISRTTGRTFEIPLLAKYRVPGEVFRPFVLAGFSYRRLASFEQRVTTAGVSGSVRVSDPPELTKRSSSGATVGGGIEASLPLIRVSAELRYTRWGSSSFRSALGGLATQLNQADFLLGILF